MIISTKILNCSDDGSSFLEGAYHDANCTDADSAPFRTNTSTCLTVGNNGVRWLCNLELRDKGSGANPASQAAQAGITTGWRGKCGGHGPAPPSPSPPAAQRSCQHAVATAEACFAEAGVPRAVWDWYLVSTEEWCSHRGQHQPCRPAVSRAWRIGARSAPTPSARPPCPPDAPSPQPKAVTRAQPGLLASCSIRTSPRTGAAVSARFRIYPGSFLCWGVPYLSGWVSLAAPTRP